MHSISSRDFTGRVAEAKRWTTDGPVFITDRGTPAHVLISFEEYQRLIGASASLVDLLAMEDADAIEFEPSKANLGLRVPDLGDEA